MTQPIAILGALEAEIEALKAVMQDCKAAAWQQTTFYEGLLFGQRVVLAQSGVGKVMAAMVTQKLLDSYQPQYLLFTGVAGGLHPDYAIGDIVIAKDCVQHDMDAIELGFPRGQVPYTEYRYLATDAVLRALALTTTTPHPLHEGRILTGDHFMTKKALHDYRYLTEELAGDAVEMEGAAVGLVCTYNQVPFLIIRTLSDKANEAATVNFLEFLPVVAANSFAIIEHLLSSHQTI
jgi:5'-methylthioadenosine/S-adenosylhomocysteine nucleosidase